jgi:hypothetical protein
MATPATDAYEAEWTREAARLHGRYVREVVETCGLCPWAERARVTERTRDAVLLQRDADSLDSLDASLAVLDRFAADPRVEVGFLIYPRLQLGRGDFDRFTARIRDADAARHPLGGIPYVLAAFHPDALPDASDPDRLVPFLRRTPDPCIQALRASVLEHVRSGAPQGTQLVDVAAIGAALSQIPSPVPLRERIARTNFDTAHRLGIDELTRRFDAIRRDRHETYESLSNPARRLA